MTDIIKGTVSDLQLKRMTARLQSYEALIDAAAPLFELDGVSLESACKNHAQNLMFYNNSLQECRTIEDVVKLKLEEVEGQLYKKYNENHQRALGQRDIGQYIKGDPAYVEIYEVFLEVVLIKRNLESIVDALKSMGWSLNNIVKLRIAQLEDVTL